MRRALREAVVVACRLPARLTLPLTEGQHFTTTLPRASRPHTNISNLPQKPPRDRSSEPLILDTCTNEAATAFAAPSHVPALSRAPARQSDWLVFKVGIRSTATRLKSSWGTRCIQNYIARPPVLRGGGVRGERCVRVTRCGTGRVGVYGRARVRWFLSGGVSASNTCCYL